jgi:uncharacterized protein (TIGR02118 family)
MYSVIGLLRKPDEQGTGEFRRWWLTQHVPHVLRMPGLRDYRLWTVDETLSQSSLQFSSDVPYDGVAVITFDSKEAFETSIASPEGTADNDSFNSGAPSSTVLAGTCYVFLQGNLDVAAPETSGA